MPRSSFLYLVRPSAAQPSCILTMEPDFIYRLSMIPFLHIGPLAVPTYGLMVAIGMLVAAYLLQFDINRHREQFIEHDYLKGVDKKSQGDEAFLIIGIIGVSGLVGARLYSVLESPRELLANPAVLISRYGFTWSGSVLTTLVAMIFLARHFDIPVLEFMDLCAPPAALGGMDRQWHRRST